MRGDPVGSDGLERGIVGGAPVGRKISEIDASEFGFVEWERSFAGDEVVWGHAGVEMDEELDRCQG